MTLDSLFSALHPRRHFLVAFSGGLDSTVLLHQLVQLRETHPDVTVRAIHIHHGLSPNADGWVAHCRAVCERWNVVLNVQLVTLPKTGSGIEADARRARYGAFAAALRPGEALLTGQHRDDQCETLLLALKRGSGPAGLAAMPARMAFAGGELIRPLLSHSRADLAQWARAHRLCWIEDESNHSARFERNFLRLEVLPILTARWPHFADAAARSAALCGEQEQLLDELLAEELQQLVDSRGALRIDPMKSMSEMRRAALLRRWLARCGATMPARAALTRIWQEVALSRDDASPALRIGDADVRRYQSALWWVKTRPEVSTQTVKWPSPWAPLVLPGGTLSLGTGTGTGTGTGQAVRAPHENERVTVRYRAPGLIHIIGRDRGRTLKKLWQELGVPPWQRSITPLLFYGEQLIAAPGVFVTREGALQAKNVWRISWVPDEKV